MEEIQFSCTSCRITLTASKSDVGEVMQCPDCGHAVKVPVYGVIKGMKLGDFTIEQFLGAGGMGEVWLAMQESLQRKVAIKILSPEIAKDESFVRRFRQEVKIAGQLIHPNIVVAFHAGEQDGIRYLTTTYVDGAVASELLEKNSPMNEYKVLLIGREIAKALKYAWEKFHILHRDVKPDNIMISNDGTPMLMDIGISKQIDEDISLTMTGEIIGTPNYISPEQVYANPDIDSRADQYSLGATLFHLLSGMLPYRGTSAMGILAQHLQAPVPDVKEYNPEISEECSIMIQKMMAKSRDERYSSWDDFIMVANALLPPEMRDGTMLPGTLMPSKQNNKKYIVIGVLFAIIVIGMILLAFILGMETKKTVNNVPKITMPPPSFSDKTVEKKQSETTYRKPGKKGHGKKHGDRKKRDFMVSRLQEKFKISESQAGKIADKIIPYFSKRKDINKSRAKDSPSEHKRKWKEELTPLKEELLKTAKQVLGKAGLSKFKAFLNEMGGKTQKPFGGRRRPHY